MSIRYAPLPTHSEMDAAFDGAPDDDELTTSVAHPLNPHIPGTYNFDYDYPPPGSPPRPSTVALPNDHGNTNGLIPSFHPPPPSSNWLSRTASHYAQRFGLSTQRPPSGAIGGGTNNDGVFANVTAKPSRPLRIQDGDDTLLVPEDARQEAPPSYAHAQADAVPPYWDTTVLAPFSSVALGELVIDALPTGSIFSFFWNMLVSISFQFVGFLLTYLLHTSHAARLGSRAGLGITLIQYGFALRSKVDPGDGESTDSWGSWRAKEAPPRPTFATAAEAKDYYTNLANNATAEPSPTVSPEEQSRMMVADATTEWLSFFLMTIGWFMLLTSVLGFWRVKRWERNIVAAQRETAAPTATEDRSGSARLFANFEEAFPGILRSRNAGLLRQGLGFRRSRNLDEEEGATGREMEPMISSEEDDPEERLQVQAHEQRLRDDLQAAGLL